MGILKGSRSSRSLVGPLWDLNYSKKLKGGTRVSLSDTVLLQGGRESKRNVLGDSITDLRTILSLDDEGDKNVTRRVELFSNSNLLYYLIVNGRDSYNLC